MRKLFERPAAVWAWLGLCVCFLAWTLVMSPWWISVVWVFNIELVLDLLLKTYALQRLRRGEEERFLGPHMDLIQHWSQFWDALRGEPHNWYTFTPFQLELEHDKMLGGVEFTLILLGLGARVRYNYAMTEAFETIKAGAEEVRRMIEEDGE